MSEPYKTDDEVQVKGRKRKDEAMRDQQVEDLRTVMSTPSGRRWVWLIMAKAGIFQTSFTGNSTTFFNEGARSIGLWLTSELMSDLRLQELYLTMQSEAMKEKTNG